jgi:hypothetical protein
MSVTNEGDELAPEEEVCEPVDCANCDKRDTCEDYDPEDEDEDEDEDEELAIEEIDKQTVQPVACAVGAMVISPALQRGVDETNNSSGVP